MLSQPFTSGISFWIAVFIFIAAYAVIILDRIPKTTVAVIGASLILVKTY
jgi:Na+/H+ antiporter NhaD/arsenite permease-like protein